MTQLSIKHNKFMANCNPKFMRKLDHKFDYVFIKKI